MPETRPLISVLPSFAFVCPSNCASVSFTLMTAVRPFAHVRAGKVVVLLLDITLFTAEIVEHTGERGFKALLMGTAVRSVYIVCKGKDQLVVAVVILKRHFGDGVVKLPLQIYYVRVQHLKLPLLVDVVHKAADAALVAHALLLFRPARSSVSVMRTPAFKNASSRRRVFRVS